MAEITDTLRLDIDQALADVNRLERALDVAIAPIEVEVDTSEALELEQTLRDIERIAERATTETADMALAAGRAEANFEDLARALGVSEDEARRMTGELLQAQAAANRVEDAARDIARQLGLSESEAARLTRELRQADQAADAIDVTALSVAGRFTSIRVAAASITGALAGIGGAAILGKAIQGANAAIQSFAQLEDSINAVNVIFGKSSDAVIEFGETAARSAGLSQQAFNQAVVPIGSLLQNFGFDAQAAADASVILVQRAADLASVLGGSVQDALLAVGAALRGEADPLERYGASISAARVEQFALANGLAATKAEITPAITLQARYGLILADTAKVQGDYLNTADDLANAQRSAGAAAQNFGADLGEDLAPAMEVIVGLLPEMLEGLRQLVPSLIAASDSAASFFQSVGEGGGTRTEFATGAAILETLNPIEQGLGLATEAVHTFGGAVQDILGTDGEFTQSSAAMARAGRLIEEQFTKSIGVNLARALDDGQDAAEAFTTAIRQMARSSQNLELFEDSFRGFAVAANLTDEELQAVTIDLLANADAIGLTTDEVTFLQNQLALLNDLLNGTDVGAQRTANRIRDDLGESLNTVTTRFTTFSSELEGEIQNLDSFVVDAAAAAAEIGEALDPFKPAAEAIDISAKEFFNNLVAQIEQQAEAQANIARLIALGFDDVAAEIAKAGPGANRAAEQFLENLDLAEKAERLLEGEGTAISRQIGDELTAELASTTLTSEVEAAFLTLIEQGIFTNAQVEAAILDGSRRSANVTVTAYRDELEAEAAAFDAAFLADSIGAAIGASLDFSDQAAAAATRTVDAYEQAFKDEFEISSPSKLMMRLGEEVMAGFLQGSEMGDLQLRVPTVPTGGLITGTPNAGAAGGINVSLTTINPIQQDEVSDTARMGQIASSIAASYRSVVPNGM